MGLEFCDQCFASGELLSVEITLSNIKLLYETPMIKSKLKKTVLRRDSATSAFKADIQQRSSFKELIPPRTADDESIEVFTAQAKPLAMNAKRDTVKRSSNSQLQVDDLMDRLNIHKMAEFLKATILRIIDKILKSRFINSVNDGKIHIHSFGLGIAMTTAVVMIQPFLVVYLDSWIILLGKLLKHLMAWLVVGGVLTYVLNPKKGDHLGERGRKVHFQELQYSVKSSEPSRDSSPSKAKRVSQTTIRRQPVPLQRFGSESSIQRRGPQFDDPQMLISMTTQMQDVENSRYERSKTGYDTFMEGAFRKEEEEEKYRKFIDDNRYDIRKKSQHSFGIQ
jgi:hypothetical protein